MIPTLQDGDVILVDITQSSSSPPGVLFFHDGICLVARWQEFIPMTNTPQVRIISARLCTFLVKSRSKRRLHLR